MLRALFAASSLAFFLNSFVYTSYAGNPPSLSPLNPVKGPPRIKLFYSPELEGCVKDLANVDGVVRKQSQWILTCPVDQILEVSARLRSRLSKRNLSDASLLARAFLEEIKKQRKEILGAQSKPSENFLESSDSQTWLELEKKFYDTIDPYIKESQAWLEPIFKSKGLQESPLSEESALYFLRILGESWRFKDLLNLLEENGAKLGDSKRSTQISLLKDMVKWVQDFGPPPLVMDKPKVATALKNQNSDSENREIEWPVRTWVLKRLIAQRPQIIAGTGGENEFYLWTKSLFLSAPPQTDDEKKKVLGYLQDLWIAFPKFNQGVVLRDLAKYLGVHADFQPLPLKDYSIDQLMVRARAQVRYLDSLGALRTLKRVRQIPVDKLTDQEIWEAFIYQVKVLRLLDERPQIPATITGYLSYKDFLSVPNGGFKSASEAQKYFSRLHELARLYWNYDDPKKALDILDKIVSKNQVMKTDYFLGPALVIRARIAEQNHEASRAMDLMDQALASKITGDLALDLLWRKVFLQLDRVKKENISTETLVSLMEPIRKYADRDPSEKQKWNYWYARFHAMNGKTREAKKYFQITYELESFSYYSNLAGLELIQMGESPVGWKPLDKTERIQYDEHVWETPNWELFLTQNGTPTQTAYRDLARVLLLVRVGDLEMAQAALPDLDKLMWSKILSNQISWKLRREMARSVSWLRRSMNDPMGSLRVAEIARQAAGKDYDKEDYLNLYPLPFWNLIEKMSQERGLEAHVVASLIRQESAFNPEAKSWANAIGLMQIIPPVAEEEAKLMGIEQFEPEKLYSPEFAVQLGTHHLSRLYQTFQKSWICSIASYNAGSPPVRKWLDYYSIEIPESFIERIPFLETRNYVKSILRNYLNYFRVYGANSETVDASLLFKMPQNIERIPSGQNPAKKETQASL
jgi:soluble lytic murein transglycosylase-like protein